ncbi:MAG: winged helix-turn-helix transcriptional regulator [Deltaproteobacteria bacterium]|nr:winged helix-turn-helix transcriptional regulator [Deltaproteobacteria bacterium]
MRIKKSIGIDDAIRLAHSLGMKTEDIAQEFEKLYSALYLRLCRRRDPRGYCPSSQTLGVMEHLAATGPLTISEAACHFDRSQAATSEIVERMMERGLLARIQDDRDRRRHLVWLTEYGRDLLEEERRVLSPKTVLRSVSRMKKNDREALVRGMRALLEASDAAARDIICNKSKEV